jgi:hypothetical protein
VPDLPCAASTLVAGTLATCSRWTEVARTRVSVHYRTGHATAPVVCVATPQAVRLPNSLVVTELPTGELVPRVTRWWSPPRPRGLSVPASSRFAGFVESTYDDVDPRALFGRGIGLTPAGDDVLAGALVAGHATAHPALPRWRHETLRMLATRRTTAVSVGMLHSAVDGWATPELAAAVEALCGDAEPAPAVARLLGVGHSSGRHLLDGVLHVLSTHPATTHPATTHPASRPSTRQGAA